MTRYSHMYTLAYSVISEHPLGSDVTPEMHRRGIEQRVKNIDEESIWDEAIGDPDDSFEIQESPNLKP